MPRVYIKHEDWRDWAVEQTAPFTLADMEAAMASGGGQYHLRRLIRRGTVVPCGKRGKAKLYRYDPPTEPGAAAQVDIARRVATRKAGAVAVAGTGRGVRVSDPEVRAMLSAVEASGGTWEPGKNHYIVKVNGRRVAAVPKSPSDHRWAGNMRTQLRRRGLKV